MIRRILLATLILLLLGMTVSMIWLESPTTLVFINGQALQELPFSNFLLGHVLLIAIIFSALIVSVLLLTSLWIVIAGGMLAIGGIICLLFFPYAIIFILIISLLLLAYTGRNKAAD